MKSAALSADGRFLDVVVAPASLAAQADLFVAGGRGWGFGPPAGTVPASDKQTATIRLPVLSRPRKASIGRIHVDAILATPMGDFAADGLAVMPLPPPDH